MNAINNAINNAYDYAANRCKGDTIAQVIVAYKMGLAAAQDLRSACAVLKNRNRVWKALVLLGSFRTAAVAMGARGLGTRSQVSDVMYYYVSTGCRKGRQSTLQADWLLSAAQALGYDSSVGYGVSTWSTKWPKTRRADAIEEDAEDIAYDAACHIVG